MFLLYLGSNTSDTIRQYRLAVAHLKPRIVIIGLSIANEGLDVEGFLSNMKLLISEIKKNGSACMIGSVYPNNLYEKEEYELLLMTHQEMKKWKQEENLIDAFFDFMTLDDGNGHWKKGTYADPSHPNHEGHKMMFEAIDLSVFPKFLSS